jgi:translation initiation factor RLI1
MIVTFADGDSESTDIFDRFARRIESMQLQLASSNDSDVFSLVLLGRNGDGKSTFINLLLSLLAPLDSQYGFCGIKNLKYRSRRLNRKEENELRNRLVLNLDALKYLRSGDKEFNEVMLTLTSLSIESILISDTWCRIPTWNWWLWNRAKSQKKTRRRRSE